jgi:hypothetical protein
VSARPTLTTILFHWHANKRSEAAEDVFFGPLAPYFEFAQRSIDWYEPVPAAWLSNANPLVFFYTQPPFDLLRKSGRPVTWIPMWDALRFKPRSFWTDIPRNVRIVAFSEAVAQRARAAGLETLRVQYFRDPAALPCAVWAGERVAYYWNRRGLVSPRFLRDWCDALQIDRLLFNPETDPLVDSRSRFDLPTQFGRTRVEVVPYLDSRDAFFERIAPANIVLAPRTHEGVGLTFLEALARGCAVFAHDAPTMNEYLVSGETGYLFESPQLWLKPLADRARLRLRRFGLDMAFGPRPFFLPDAQPWDAISRLDLPALGARAREVHIAGHAAWRESIPRYAAFITRE